MYDLPVVPKHPVKIAKKLTAEKYDFYSSDTLETYTESLKRMNENWKYRNEKIQYVYNNLGMRSPEVSTIVDNNFFIAYGCSHTEGIGINEEDRYSNIISKKTNLKFLNFGQGGTSHNYLWTNNILSAKNLKYKPKFIVCQWPAIERVTIFDDYSINFLLTGSSEKQFINPQLVRFWYNYIITPKFYNQQSIFYFEGINQLWKNLGVPVIHFTLDVETHKVLGIKKFEEVASNPYDRARDLHHPGSKSNLNFANYILNELNLI